MLRPEENERLTRVGPGTPMGVLLRRYWHPVACSDAVTTKPKRVKLLGEELVLYRGESGAPVLMELRCLHRNVALDYGRVEGDSIRCPYHGWLYDEAGQCVAQPCEIEPNSSMSKVRLKAYRTEEVSGLVFAYMGPEPAPVLPIYDVLRMTQGHKQIRTEKVETNWLQGAENIVDTTHFAWLHGHTFPNFGEKKNNAHFERTSYGLEIHMQVEGAQARTIAPYVFPGTNRFALPVGGPGAPMMEVLQIRVPCDDTSHETYFIAFVPSDKPLSQEELVVREVRIDSKFGDYRPLENDWWGIDLSDQDRMAIEQQDVISDRTREHLVASDLGIVQMRRLIRDALDAVERGKDPVGIIRDPAKQNVEFRLSFGDPHREMQDHTDYRVGLFAEEVS